MVGWTAVEAPSLQKHGLKFKLRERTSLPTLKMKTVCIDRCVYIGPGLNGFNCPRGKNTNLIIYCICIFVIMDLCSVWTLLGVYVN